MSVDSARPVNGSKGKEKEKDTSKLANAPVITPVTEQIARKVMRHFIVAQLDKVGFTSASTPVLEEIERNVLQLVMQLYTVARDYAHVSNRVNPNSYDLLAACVDAGVEIDQFRRLARKKRRTAAASNMSKLLPPPAPPPIPLFLPSDSSGDEEDTTESKSKPNSKGANAKGKDGKTAGKNGKGPLKASDSVLPKTLRDLPKHMPSLPPKHTYLRTAPPPPPTRTLASLESKLQTSLLVQESLRGLVQGTDDVVPEPTIFPNGHVASQPDAQPPPTLEETGMGGLVNFEAAERTQYGTKRKRWRL